jgi:hypothetical protein
LQPDIKSHKPKYYILGLVLLVGLIHGLIFLWIMPPWQHYDEPNHFEYAWLLAQRGVRPQPGDYDLEMRRSVAKSMLDHGFFAHLDFQPDLKSANQPAWIGEYSQVNNPPLYYALVAFVFRLISSHDIEGQLYTGRLVSLIFFLISLLAAWGVAGELTPLDHPLRLLLPMTLALLPGYVDIMTAVNNDSAAIALVCLFIWAGIRLVQRGFTLITLALMMTIAGMCYWTKDTTYVVYPLAFLILLFAIFRNSRRRLAWAVVASSLIVGCAAAIEWGDAAGWYRPTSQADFTRGVDMQAVVGNHAFQLDNWAKATPAWVDLMFQPVPALTGVGLPAKTYTLGGWMWASQPVKAFTPELGSGNSQVRDEIDLGIEPTFFAITMTLPGGRFQRVWVNFQKAESTAPVTIFYDALVLAEGARPKEQPPVYSDANASQGEWGGVGFQNLLRNASAEQAGPRIRPWLDNLGARLLPDNARPSILLSYVLDWEGALWLYRASGLRLLRTFWGMFGWGQVPLLGPHPYRGFSVITILGILGAVVWLGCHLQKQLPRLPWESLAILGVLLAGYWGLALARSPVYMSMAYVYLPVARSAFPAIIPTAILLGTGWFAVVQSVYWSISRLSGRIKTSGQNWWQGLSIWTYALLFVALDVYSFVSITTYYGRT